MKAAFFHDLRDELVAEVDAVMAEPVVLTFMKDRKLDPSRPRIEIEAVLRSDREKAVPITGITDRNWKTELSSHSTQLSIDRSRYSDIELHKGDVVQAISRMGKPIFEVQYVDGRSHDRLIVTLGMA